MKYDYLGNTGLQVSRLCFGTMSFGGDADNQTSLRMYEQCRDAGINFFDCANTYQKGIAEEILGECIKGHRDELILTTKTYFPMSERINDRGASRKNIRLSLESSLRRLGTDYIDIFFIHHFDENTSLEETLHILDQFVRDGKILYTGVSNFAAWQVMKGLGISAKEGLAQFKCIQPMYNLMKRQAEVELFPLAESESLGVITYSPLAGGLLSGKFINKEQKTEGRMASNVMYQIRYGDERNADVARDFTKLAEDEGIHPVALAIAWAGSHPAVTAPIIGARNSLQLADSLKAADVIITPDLRQRISALSAAPASATDRSEETTVFDYSQQLNEKKS